MRKWVCIFCGVVCLGFNSLARGADFQVDNSIALQVALFAAGGNGQDDTITLAPGEYNTVWTGTFNYTPISIENRSLTLIGAGPDQTILDGIGIDQIFKIDTTGLTTDSGADISFQGMSFRNGNTPDFGAGLSILTNDADVRVEDCNFESNVSAFVPPPGSSQSIGGSGLFAWAIKSGDVSVIHSRFSKNSAPQASGAGSFTIAVQGDMVLEGNTYIDNSAVPPGGFADTFGGGAAVVAVDGGLIINGNTFLNNFAGSGGGGLLTVAVNGTGLITNNIIAGNLITSSNPSTPEQTGGGGLSMVVPLGSVALTNNTITDNRAIGAPAGGLFVYQAVTQAAMVTAFNNIIWGNSAAPGSLCADSCNDIRVMDDVDLDNKGASFTISHSDFSDISFQCVSPACTPDQHVDVASNLDENPLFLSPGQDDFHLADNSNLIDKGDPLAPGLPPEDFDGEARIQGAAPDMGAFEFVVSEGGGGEGGSNGGGGTGGGAEGQGSGGSGGCTLGTGPHQGTLFPGTALGLTLMGLFFLGRHRTVKKSQTPQGR